MGVLDARGRARGLAAWGVASRDVTEYEYSGLIAESWDLLRGDTSGWADRPFWRQQIEASGQPALDVGCGTGRLLLDYLGAGVDVDGVDNSPEMLSICREKAAAAGLHPTLYQQSMQELDLPRTYRTIMVPSSSFQLLTDERDAAEAMARFFRHLAPGGTLAMPFMVLGARPDDDEGGEGTWKLVAAKTRPEDGAVVRRWSRSTFDRERQLEHTEDRYEVLRDGQVVASEHHSRSPATRWYEQAQARGLYEAAGFVDVRLVHGFTFEPAAPDDTLFCVLGAKP